MTALESVGIEVDPLNQRLKRLPAVRLKRADANCEDDGTRREVWTGEVA